MSHKLLKTRVLECFAKPDSRAMGKSELARALKVPPADRSELKAVLRDLRDAGKLVEGRGGRYGLPTPARPNKRPGLLTEASLTGRLIARAGGVLFVPDPTNPANS